MRPRTSLALTATLYCLASPAWAQLTIPQEYDKTIKATNSIGTLGNDLFGEQTSLYTGATSFNAVDVSLPGNNGLSVEIRRRFTVTSTAAADRPLRLSRDGGFADWELDLPYLQGIYAHGLGWQVGPAGSNQRCSYGADEAPTVEGPGAAFGRHQNTGTAIISMCQGADRRNCWGCMAAIPTNLRMRRSITG